MSTFGGGHDLSIGGDSCNTNSSLNYSNLGHTYVCPDEHTNASEGAKAYLAGAYNFVVSDIEVYKITYNE